MTPEQQRHLAMVRAQVDALDERLLALLAERGRVVDALWAWKQAEGLPQTDPRREAELVERLVSRARDLGLDSDAVRDVLRAIVGRKLTGG